ncbi:hypothetical protein [Acinetobacter sp. PK01]|uniref:hypothetical protein n=1 Tax=Acinetobacter sp. PK01 TaxID=2930198 RepID=UPI001FB612E5|nr:hypothetical protein [Acinetobacter sp. PK01]UOG18657.1 hypothetical protein MP622_03335 [Acinetobacter sp. PK01]
MLFRPSDIENLKVCDSLAISLNISYDLIFVGNPIYPIGSKEFKDLEGIFFGLYDFILKLDRYFYANNIVEVTFVNRFDTLINHLNDEYLNVKIKNNLMVLFEAMLDFCEGPEKFHNYNNEFDIDVKAIRRKIHDFVENKDLNNGSYVNDDSETINHKINDLNARMEALYSRIDDLLVTGEGRINQIHREISAKGSETLANLQLEISNLQASTEQNITQQIEKIKTDLAKSKTELVELFGDLESYKSIVSHETEKEVSKHYAKKAFWEMLTYWAATILSIVIIVVSICLAWSGLNGYFETYVQETDPVKLKALAQTARYAEIYLGFRLVLSFLLFSTVIYTSRIAYRAYIHWRHSESMKLKLSSLRPFINQLEPDDRKQIHKDLVPDYFGKDAGMIDVAGEKFKDFPTNVSAVVMKAMDHANGALGNSKKDEPAKDDKSSAEKDKKEEA